MTELPFHRRTWMTLEPIHGMVYFSPLAAPIYESLGLVGREGYFASRSAAMGAVSVEVVISTFFNFAPDLVRGAIPSAWTKASPQMILDARNKIVVDTLNQYCADHTNSTDTQIAAGLAKTIALESCKYLEGRPLFAAHAALPWPDESQPALVLWHAQTLLREYRGDGHIAALVTEGLSGLDAHISHIATQTLPTQILRSTRAWDETSFQSGVDRMVDRGLVVRNADESLALTEKGAAQRQHIEDLTDKLAAAPYVAAGESTCTELRRSARPLAQAVVATGLSPLRQLPQPLADNS
jgi:hypothetical protein